MNGTNKFYFSEEQVHQSKHHTLIIIIIITIYINLFINTKDSNFLIAFSIPTNERYKSIPSLLETKIFFNKNLNNIENRS